MQVILGIKNAISSTRLLILSQKLGSNKWFILSIFIIVYPRLGSEWIDGLLHDISVSKVRLKNKTGKNKQNNIV